MKSAPAILRRSRWPTCMLAMCLITAQTRAATLTPGQTRDVAPGDPVESWTLTGATLNVQPGASTLGISATAGSTLDTEGATTGRVSVTGSTATLIDTATTSLTGIGLSVVKTGIGGAGSVVQVTNGVINGVGRGVNVSGGSVVTLTNTQATGTGSGPAMADKGHGVTMVGGAAIVEGGSTVTGSNRGAYLADSGPTDTTPSLIIDASTVTGLSGSGVFVNSVSGNAVASVSALNGALINGGNGLVLQVGDAATPSAFLTTVDFIADDSRLTGDIQAFNGNVANIRLLNNASVTGNMTDISSLALDASSMTGNLSVPAGSPVPVSMTARSAFTGSMSNIGSLTMDNSDMTGNVIEASGSTASIALNNGSTLNGALSNVGSLDLDASEMTGSVNQDASTPAALVLRNRSRLTGTVTNARSTSLDAGSTFNMVNDSSVGDLALNGGTVNLRAGNAGFRTLTASSLSGGGLFALGTDLAGHLSDLVNITGTAAGSHTLAVQNTGVDPVQEDYAQRVVHTGSGPASFAVAGGQVDVGTFVYRLEQRGTDWYLVQKQVDEGGGTDPVEPVDPVDPVDPTEPTEPTDPVNPTEPVDPVNPVRPDPVISPSARAVIGVFSAAPTVWYGELSTLRSRMGELRNGHEQGGLWARAYGNRYKVSATDQVDYTQSQSGISFGVDTPISSQDGQWLIGVMGGYSRSDLDLREGTDGQVDSYYLGAYSTWISESGYYIDALIKANRFKNKADVRMSDGAKARGDYDSKGLGGSVEAGKHIKFADGWFIEPYVQVSALWVGGESYGLDNGMRASSNQADSLLGVVGSHIGRTIAFDGGGFVQPYIKVAGVQEFARNNKVKVNRTTFSDDLSGSRGELGAGLVAQLTDVLQVHADVDYSHGDNIEQPWGVNVGVRYAW